MLRIFNPAFFSRLFFQTGSEVEPEPEVIFTLPASGEVLLALAPQPETILTLRSTAA